MRKESQGHTLADKVYQVMGHEVRRGIILYLGEHERASFSELRRNLGISVGTLYYNLDQLRDLVTQDMDKKYRLTEEGKLVYEIVKRNVEHVEEYYRLKSLRRNMLCRLVLRVFYPKQLFILVDRTPVLIIVSIISLLVGIIASMISRLELSIFFYYPTLAPHLILATKYIFSWLVVFLLSDLLSTYVFKGARGRHFELACACAIVLLPLSIYPCIYVITPWLPTVGTIGGFTLKRFILGILLGLSQLMVVGFLSAAISTIKELRGELSFIIAFIVYHINLTFNMALRPTIAMLI
ncbi:MAG: hypothetical protein DRN15_01235 [Thermoprotei archaeon]|nr:MAG: hypothetical protein DRN15_01235 [Thermoprotei archaeon]RLF25803.1 MAG: hypothetical protein DRM97_00580 [Thermoprotei archaeon]